MSDTWIDENYLKLISSRLQGFTPKGHHKYACRCPLCGDSDKKKNKKRGGFYVKEGRMMYKCFNCGESKWFSTFLKDFDPNLYKQYAFEKFKGKLERESAALAWAEQEFGEEKHVPETQKYIPDIFDTLPLVSTLDEKHRAFIISDNRKLPIYDREIYYAKKFIEWTKGHTDKFASWKDDDQERIVFPWRDRNGKIIGYSARALDPEITPKSKYYRIFLDDMAKERYFGIDKLDETKQKYVLEGEIDSMMIPNAIALANGKLHTYIDKNAIYIPDADRRNKHICKGISEMIDLGLKVCLIPDGSPGKDLNELVVAGMSQSDILKMIHSNTFQGLEARLRFNAWKVVTL